MAITTFQEKHALPSLFVSEGKKYWVMIERVCVTLLTFTSNSFSGICDILLVGNFLGSF